MLYPYDSIAGIGGSMGKSKYRVNLTDTEKAELERLLRKQTQPQNIVRRVQIILMANRDGLKNVTIAEELGIFKSDITKWTKRWVERADCEVEERLSDMPRPGAPGSFTPEQLCQIMALACELPENHGRPIARWTHVELAEETIKQGIVESISPSHLGRLLKKWNYSLTEVATG